MSFAANFIGINKYANQSIGINRCLSRPYFILKGAAEELKLLKKMLK
jgi:hypothetical protein